MKDSAYSNANSSGKNKSFLTIVIVLVFLVVSVSLLAIKRPDTTTPTPKTTNTYKSDRSAAQAPPNAPLYNLKFDNPSGALKAGSKYKVTVQVQKVDKNLTAATLNLTYDPKFIKVDNIASGNVWTKSNDFTKKLDVPGKVEYTFVRALGTDVSDKMNLAVLDITVLPGVSGSTPIALDPDSQIATVVEHVNYRVMAEPILLSITK